MTWMIPRNWRAFALALPSLAVLAAPLGALARESAVPNQERQRESMGDMPVSGRAGIVPPVDGPDTFAPRRAAGMPLRRVTPDQDRMRELSGEVVKLNGMVLYVQTRVGAVVPVDVSALELRRTPEPGQTVVAVYQVENGTENVAVSLYGEVPERG